ncbi:MAG: RibD family protein [Candidatus Roizmanbacteria bacterium]|nr:RibD family protein [Candidatus Roizmanbacteria bacterium]
MPNLIWHPGKHSMQFQPFSFQKPDGRPFFFTSFVSTIDGKIIVKEKGYWPIGTKEEKKQFTYLRAHADAIVDAKNTAVRFGKYTIRTLHSELFQEFRKDLGKDGLPEYIVLTSNPDEALKEALKNDHGFETKILTPEEGSKRVSIPSFIKYLNSQGHKHVFINGGPTFLAQLLQAQVLDEIQLSIAPKIFGSLPGKTLTMVEGMLFSPEEIPQFNLTSVDRIGDDEVVLRYSFPRLADRGGIK